MIRRTFDVICSKHRQLQLADIYSRISSRGNVLDVGCFGFRQVEMGKRLGLPSLKHAGIDFTAHVDVPDGFTFRQADLNADPIPFDADTFDLVVCNHILEHVRDPIELFAECVRVCKPGGFIVIETPSERSLWLPGFPYRHEQFFSLSFYDDPTHVGRPWTPQSLYRLTRYFQCEPVEVGYRVSWRMRMALPILLPLALVLRSGGLLERCVWQAVGWVSYLIVAKPPHLKGRPELTYYVPAER